MSLALRILPLAALPLFVCLPNGEIPMLHLFGYHISRDSINLNWNVIQCLYGAFLFFSRPLDRRLGHFLIFSLLWLGLSLCCGLTYECSSTNVAFFTQTILPLFAIPYGYHLVQREFDVERVVRIAAATTAIFLCGLTLIVMWRYGPVSLLTERLKVMAELELAMPQFKSYYPVAVQFTFSLALAEYVFGNRSNSRAAFMILTAHALIVPFCWSRAGLLGIALCAAVQFALAFHVGGITNVRRVLGIVAAFAVFLPVLFAQMGTTVASRHDVSELNNASDIRRLELAIEGAQRIYERPLFGDMFVPAWDERVGGEDVDVKRLFGAHNQYVDMALRGGILYLVVLGVLINGTYKRARCLSRLTRSGDARSYIVLGVASCSYILATLVSSNFQLYLIQLQTAVPFYIMVGVTYKANRLLYDNRAALSLRTVASHRRAPAVSIKRAACQW